MKISESLFSIPISIKISRADIADMKRRILRDFEPSGAAKPASSEGIQPIESAKAGSQPEDQESAASTAGQGPKA
jgi:hypothetical protein